MSSLTLDMKTTALVLIDLEEGIVGLPLAPRPGPEVVKNAIPLLAAFRQRKATVVLVRVEMAELLNLPVDSPMRPSNAPPPPPEASRLVSEVGPEPGDFVITKRQWGAFHATELDQQLRRRGIKTIVLGGIATNFGAESTARSAVEHGYELVLVEDVMTSVSAEAHEFAIRNIFPRIGRVRSAAEVIEAIR